MKGYYSDRGFYGYVDGRYVLFSDETDYYEYVEELYICFLMLC